MINEILIGYRGTLTAILVALIGILGAFTVQRYIAYRNAAAVFRAAFTDALSHLRNSTTCPFDVLDPAFPAHEAAVYEFSRFLIFKRKTFLQAWGKYAYHENQPKYRFLEQYSSKGQSISEKQRRQKLVIDRLEHLISFAGHA